MKNCIGVIIIALICPIASGQSLESFKEFFRSEAKKNNEYTSRVQYSESMLSENMEKYDVFYYGLEFNISPEKREIKGEVSIYAHALSELETLELNYPNFNMVHGVSLAEYRDTELTFQLQSRKMVIELDRNYAANEDVKVVIAFTSKNQDWLLNFTTYKNLDLVFTWIGDTDRTWFPNKLSLEDKADSVDMHVTVQSDMVVAANGTLKEIIQSGDSSTYIWQERYPISPVIIAFAAYPYDVYSDWYVNVDNDSMEILIYTFPDIYEQAKEVYATEKDMLSFFEELFGPYPFFEEKYGHVEVTKPNSLEMQNMVFLSTSHALGEYAYMTVAHELAHQWMGACVSNQSWHHIWIIEGFATYASGLWYQEVNSVENLDIEVWAYYGSGTPYVENPSPSNMYNSNLSYQKSAWVYHMLRHIVGDSIFFEFIKEMTTDPSTAYASISTEDFEEICERVSGMNLDRFFQQWIFGEYYPDYHYSWESSQTEAGYRLELTVNQVQDWQLFWMPVDVDVQTSSGVERFVIWDSLQTQVFYLDLDDAPQSVTLDPDNWVLNKSSDLTGIKNSQIQKKDVKIFPNPASALLNIETYSPGPFNIKITSLNGQAVLSHKMEGPSCQLDLSTLKSGLYFITIRSENFVSTSKIVRL